MLTAASVLTSKNAEPGPGRSSHPQQYSELTRRRGSRGSSLTTGADVRERELALQAPRQKGCTTPACLGSLPFATGTGLNQPRGVLIGCRSGVPFACCLTPSLGRQIWCSVTLRIRIRGGTARSLRCRYENIRDDRVIGDASPRGIGLLSARAGQSVHRLDRAQQIDVSKWFALDVARLHSCAGDDCCDPILLDPARAIVANDNGRWIGEFL